MEQTRAPFLEKLAEAQNLNSLAFNMPGHKLSPTLLPEVAAVFGAGVFTGDVNECMPEVDYLHSAGRELRDAQALAAAAVGSEHTFFLVGGSTVGNQAMLMAAARDGQTVIIPRAAHRSVYAGLILSGATPVYVPPLIHPQVGFPLAVPASAVVAKLAEHPQAVALQITSPNYYGYLSDVGALAELAHAHNIPVLVDEAHGAHLPFHPALPRSAVQLGADAVVQSAHKTLTALTQAAWLHLSGPRLSLSALQATLALLQSSSPSVMLTGSLDAARRHAHLHGRALLQKALELAEHTRAAVRRLPNLWCYGAELVGEHGIFAHDPTKLVIRVSEAGLSGTAFAAELWHRAYITVEFADPQHIICSISMADSAEKVELLLTHLAAIAAENSGPPQNGLGSVPAAPELPALALNPRQAHQRPSRAIPLTQAAGAVCAEQIMPYPPGIPLLMPGEIISRPMIEYLHALLALQIKIVGPEDTRLHTVRVIEA